MSFIIHSKNKTLTVRVLGELDLVSASAFRENVDDAMNETMSHNLIIDLNKVTFVDSSGLGVILGRFRKIKANGGQMVLTGLTPNIRRILMLSGILSFIPVSVSETEAHRLIEKKTFREA